MNSSRLHVAGSPETLTLLTPAQMQFWTWLFLAVGLLARSLRYFLRFPLWEDECFLCASFIDRDYAGLMEPLEYHPQVAPLLYLWTQLTLVKLLGFNEFSLRLVSFVSSIASLFLFYRLAQRCLTGLPQLFAIGLFSVTYGCVRYAAEAKPYGSDLFLALVMYNLALNWLDSGHGRWLWFMAGLTPVAIGFSYPAVFVGSGMLVALTYWMWSERRWDVPGLAGLALSLALSFGALYFVSLRGQLASDLDGMEGCWNRYFPPLSDPLRMPLWFFKVHAEDMVAYPFGGGADYGATLSFLFWATGLIILGVRREWRFLVFCLAPMAAHLGAAALRRYPYGGAFKLVIYLGPFVCMVLGYACAETSAWMARRGHRPALYVWAPLTFLMIFGGLVIARELAFPYKSSSDQRARQFAAWFWFSQSQCAEVACIKTDLGHNFSPRLCKRLNCSANYFCYQRIYSPRHAAGRPIAWDKITADHPLICVQYRCGYVPFDEEACNAWLREMEKSYVLVYRDKLPMLRMDQREQVIHDIDHVELFKFVPRR